MSLPWRILGTLAIGAALFAAGDHLGYGRAEDDQALRVAEAQRRAIEKSNEVNRLEAARLALQRERDQLALDLEDAARADPDASRPALGADSVRRLNQR